jgi:hypothetical protein
MLTANFDWYVPTPRAVFPLGVEQPLLRDRTVTRPHTITQIVTIQGAGDPSAWEQATSASWPIRGQQGVEFGAASNRNTYIPCYMTQTQAILLIMIWAHRHKYVEQIPDEGGFLPDEFADHLDLSMVNPDNTPSVIASTWCGSFGVHTHGAAVDRNLHFYFHQRPELWFNAWRYMSVMSRLRLPEMPVPVHTNSWYTGQRNGLYDPIMHLSYPTGPDIRRIHPHTKAIVSFLAQWNICRSFVIARLDFRNYYPAFHNVGTYCGWPRDRAPDNVNSYHCTKSGIFWCHVPGGAIAMRQPRGARDDYTLGTMW